MCRLAAGFGIMAVRRITGPLQALQAASLHLGRPGAQDSNKDITTTEEIGDLARTLETISGRLGRTLDSLRESEESFRDIVENSVEGFFSIDLKGRIVASNLATCATLACRPDQFIGTSYKQWLTPDMAQKAKATFNGVFTSGQPLHDVLFEARRLDGQPLMVRGNVRLLVKNGQPAGFQVMMRDVTAQQRIEAQLQRAEKVGRLADERQRNDLVIFDLTIPGGMGGLEAFRLIRRIDPAVKGIVTSGYSQDPVISDPAAYGFAGAMQKPFTIQDLSALVGRITA